MHALAEHIHCNHKLKKNNMHSDDCDILFPYKDCVISLNTIINYARAHTDVKILKCLLSGKSSME